ncbi:3',5'-cyclic nucleotide phosphodiesterase, partial [Opitutales bacterium]|nr:3',5'-cyclic nucleotide phosphodiesterase [Opitutales bacterium]
SLGLLSCKDNSASDDLVISNDKSQLISINELGFASNAFELSVSKNSQLDVFDSLFLDKGAYKLPGNPDKQKLHAFFEELREGYFNKDEGIDYSIIRKEYHTFTHAMDVMITTHALLQSGGGVYLSDGERASLVLAALGHDVLHTGVNNSFLIQVEHSYYQEMGGESLQEKRSANYVLELLGKHEILVINDGMNDLQKKQISDARDLIEQSILWTDIKRHKEQMEKVSDISKYLVSLVDKHRRNSKMEGVGALEDDYRSGLNVSDYLSKENKTLISAFILHCADISNPGKEWKHCERWAGLVMNEFFSQGDLQKKLSLKTSMNCDRNSVSVPGCQVGFGKYVINDLYTLLKMTVHDGGSYLLKNFKTNQQKWQELQSMEDNTNLPYAMKFSPPTREGGWMGELRVDGD